MFRIRKQAKSVGLTKDAGWQFGLSRAFHYPQEYLWDFMFSEKGLNIWLGEPVEELELNKSYKTKAGIEGFVRAFKPSSHIRMRWKKSDWENRSTVQVRVIGHQEKAIISFHQEKLINNSQREEMKRYWTGKMDRIAMTLTGSNR